MSGTGRGPNTRLDVVLREAGMSSGSLAHQLRQRATARGIDVSYTHRSVANWRRGTRPQPGIPRLIADILGERLGRAVTPTEIGFEPDHEDDRVGLHFPRGRAEAVAVATEFWSRMERRDVLTAGLLGSAYATPLLRWLTTDTDREPVPTTGSGPRVGQTDIDDLTAAADQIRTVDSRYGGGNWRNVLLNTALVERATPLLRGTYTDAVGRALHSAVAELGRQAGWIAFDAGFQGLAQRHFIQALRLARSAGDVPLACYVLACMGLQATLRGHRDTAVDILEAATDRAHRRATSRTASFCALIHSRVHARVGDRARALNALADAETLLGRAGDGDDDPAWIRFFGWSRLAADAVEIHRDLVMPTHARRWNSRTTDSASHTRSHGLRNIVLAGTHLQGDVDLELALHHADTAVTLLGDVTSARAGDYLTDFRERLAPWRTHPLVAGFLN